MSHNYPTTEYTFEALKNLGALSRFVSFKSIYNEVKRIRLVKGLNAEDSNTKGRIRRSLINDQAIATIRGSEQSKKLSINIKYPKYSVKPEESIIFNEKGLSNSKEVESNRYKLVLLD